MTTSAPSDAVTVSLEDFRVHHQALLQLESEVGRWTTIYAGALAIGAAVSFTEVAATSGPAAEFANPIRAAAILVLATVNAVYILALAFKGYQCQLLRLYLHDVVGRRLRQLSDPSFYGWEIWQRTVMCSSVASEGKTEIVRVAYYAFQILIPLIASTLLLGIFFTYSWTTTEPIGHWAFWLVVALTVGAAAAACSTTKTNAAWKQLVKDDRPLGARETWAKMTGKEARGKPPTPQEPQLATSGASQTADAVPPPPAG